MTSLSTQLDIGALVEMGFSKERVEVAVKSLTNPDIQSVVEWLFNHPVADNNAGHRLGSADTAGASTASEGTDTTTTKTPVENVNMETEAGAVPSENVDTSEGATASETPQQVMSLKCEDCGKLIRSEMDAQSHAARTGHQNFSESTEEIKPLTAEEKEEQKQRLQQKLKERQREREAAEKEQEKAREKTRRVTGQEITQMREEQALKEMKRIAEERRKEKLEEKRLKQKLKDEIAKDRADLKNRTAPSSMSATTTKSAAAAAPVSTAKTSEAAPVVKKEYTSSRIQFRFADGSTQNSNFGAEDKLQMVLDHVSSKVNTEFELSMTFPRKVFGASDKDKTLKELGLVPSAALVVKNRL